MKEKTTKKNNISLETEVYNQEGKSSGKITLPEEIFGLPWNADLVHQVTQAMQANARTPVAHTKTRGEVSGTGKKPWKQKGTGRARHGSRRSPIWVGGGVAHGPRNDKSYAQKINKKMKMKALFTALSQKFRDSEVLFVDEVLLKNIKTKDANNILKNLSKISGFTRVIGGKKENTYITVPAKNDTVKKSFSNIPSIIIDEIKNINPLDVMKYKYLIICHPIESFAFLGGKIEKSRLKTKVKKA